MIENLKRHAPYIWWKIPNVETLIAAKDKEIEIANSKIDDMKGEIEVLKKKLMMYSENNAKLLEENTALKLKLETLDNTYKGSLDVKLKIWERCKKAEQKCRDLEDKLMQYDKTVSPKGNTPEKHVQSSPAFEDLTENEVDENRRKMIEPLVWQTTN